jgi:hypothetical protein
MPSQPKRHYRAVAFQVGPALRSVLQLRPNVAFELRDQPLQFGQLSPDLGKSWPGRVTDPNLLSNQPLQLLLLTPKGIDYIDRRFCHVYILSDVGLPANAIARLEGGYAND